MVFFLEKKVEISKVKKITFIFPMALGLLSLVKAEVLRPKSIKNNLNFD